MSQLLRPIFQTLGLGVLMERTTNEMQTCSRVRIKNLLVLSVAMYSVYIKYPSSQHFTHFVKQSLLLMCQQNCFFFVPKFIFKKSPPQTFESIVERVKTAISYSLSLVDYKTVA